jgi:hypothetical protein
MQVPLLQSSGDFGFKLYTQPRNKAVSAELDFTSGLFGSMIQYLAAGFRAF